jgi:hypothetical protein
MDVKILATQISSYKESVSVNYTFKSALLIPTVASSCYVRREKFDPPQCMGRTPVPYCPTDEIYSKYMDYSH